MENTLHQELTIFRESLLQLDRTSLEQAQIRYSSTHGPLSFIEKILTPVMESIGKDWETGVLSMAEVYMTSKLCEELVNQLLLEKEIPRRQQPRLAIAVLIDHHVLGKRIVTSALRAAGFDLLDYGSQSPEGLAQKVQADNVEILLVSALMLSSALKVKDLRQFLNQRSPGTRLLVGGAPFRYDPNLWQEVGADAMGMTASDAPRLIESLSKDLR